MTRNSTINILVAHMISNSNTATARSSSRKKATTKTMGNHEVAHDASMYHDDKLTELVDCFLIDFVFENQKSNNHVEQVQNLRKTSMSQPYNSDAYFVVVEDILRYII